MTDYKKVSELDATTTVQSNDLLDISKDNGDTTYTSKKITFGNFKPVNYVRANRNSSTGHQSIPSSTWTTIIFDEEVEDTLGQYDPVTGIFTAANDGIYQVSTIVHWASTLPGYAFHIGINNNGTRSFRFIFNDRNFTYFGVNLSAAIQLSATNTVRIDAYHSYTSARNIYCNSDLQNVLTIVRLF